MFRDKILILEVAMVPTEVVAGVGVQGRNASCVDVMDIL